MNPDLRHLGRPGFMILLGLLAWMAAGLPAAGQGKTSAAETRLADKVLPLLRQKCWTCHGDEPKKLRGELDLRTRTAALKGGAHGPVLVPGEPERSPLYLAITRRDPDRAMPPKESEKLSPAEVELVRQWIAGGAPWPEKVAAGKPAWEEEVKDGITVATSGGRTPEWTNRKYRREDLWAYQPLRPVVVPDVGVRGIHPIDAFLLAKLRSKGIRQLAPPADTRTLLRRATFDLTGLPPTPEEMDEMDGKPQAAFPAVIDRLLASPSYGERMAQHWLDVVRYADTSGFSNDYERPAAWRYRDYVIRSFNADRPFDRFIIEQIAGDEAEPNNPEMLIAVGFLRMGPWEHTGMSVAAVTRQHFLDDVTHSIGVTFLAQGLRCASCHDHKFDPIPTKDYYRLQAVFAATQFADRPVPFLPAENVSGFAAGKALVKERLRRMQENHARLLRKSEEAIAALLKQRGVRSLSELPDAERPKKQQYGLTKLELSLIRIYKKGIDYFERELMRFEPYAFSVYNGPANNYNSNKVLNLMPARREGPLPRVHILTGGALDAPAEEVTPGVLSALAESPIPQERDGRRLALARWIASPKNPLTARVIVNRVWQMHFGRGLVATPNNFGKMGKRPTHPELLDWLANWFIDNGWSLKKLHRLIMTSAAYQQAGTHPELAKLRELDPNNELLAYFPQRRLSAEEIRDAMLAVSGELNREMGGPGIFPEINWEVALQPRHIMGSVAPAYQPSPRPEQRNRRTIYVFRYRTLADPIQEVFNRPGSETSCECRDQTTVTPQVFALFNSDFAHDRALALAVLLEKKARNLEDRITLAFRRVLGRAPSQQEQALCQAHVEKMTEHHRRHPPPREELPTRVTRRMVEEQTGEEFSWEEELDGMQVYQRDLKPWQVGAATRALADLCLVLLNANEFLYVR